MALVLNIEQGKSVFVGDTEIVVTEILACQRFKVCVKENWADRNFEITNRIKTPVLPQVTISAGTGTNKLAKLHIEAPKTITILRQELKERGRSD